MVTNGHLVSHDVVEVTDFFGVYEEYVKTQKNPSKDVVESDVFREAACPTGALYYHY